MAKFCGICGARVEEATGLCPVCDAARIPKPAVAAGDPLQTESRPTSPTFGQRLKKFFVQLVLWLFLIAVILVTVSCLLTYWGVADIPYAEDVLQIFDIEPPDNGAGESRDELDSSTDIQTEPGAIEEPTQIPTEPQIPEDSPTQDTAHMHTYYVDSIVNATCTDAGYTLYLCSCGESYMDHITGASGHKYTSSSVAGTENNDGYTLHICTQCGHRYKDTYTEKDPQVKPTEDTSTGGTYTLNYEDVALRSRNETFDLYLSDENGNHIDIVWTSENPSIVSVSGNTVTALATGTTRVSAEYKGKSYSCIVRSYIEP